MGPTRKSIFSPGMLHLLSFLRRKIYFHKHKAFVVLSVFTPLKPAVKALEQVMESVESAKLNIF